MEADWGHASAVLHLCLTSFFSWGILVLGVPCWLSGKESTCNSGATGDASSITGLGRSPGEEHGNPLQYSCLENPMDKGARWATVHRVTKSQIRMKRPSTHTHIVALECLVNYCGTMMWISYMYTYIPSSWDLSPWPLHPPIPPIFLPCPIPPPSLLYRFPHKALHEINHTPRPPPQARFLGSRLKIITLRPFSKDGKKKKCLPFS